MEKKGYFKSVGHLCSSVQATKVYHSLNEHFEEIGFALVITKIILVHTHTHSYFTCLHVCQMCLHKFAYVLVTNMNVKQR